MHRSEAKAQELRGVAQPGLEYASGGRVVAGSNPVTPTENNSLPVLSGRLLFFVLSIYHKHYNSMRNKFFIGAVALLMTGGIWKAVTLNGKTTMETQVSRLVGNTLSFPQQFEIPGSTGSRAPLGYIVVCYDSTVCATCEMRRIYEWKTILDETEGKDAVMPVFIFTPGKRDRQSYESERDRSALPYKVVSDYEGLMYKDNPFLAQGSSLNVLLADRERKIIFTGNPLHNNLIMEIYRKYTAALIRDNGHVSNETAREISNYINNRQHPQSGLYLYDLSADIGDIEAGVSKTMTFEARNISDNPVEIEMILTDCDCIQAGTSSSKVMPKEKIILTATVNTDMRGRFQHFVYIKVSGCEQELIVTVNGNCI